MPATTPLKPEADESLKMLPIVVLATALVLLACLLYIYVFV